jgi:PAS domain-containing protein
MQQEVHYVNTYWSQISDLSFEEALGNGWFKAVHEDDKIANGRLESASRNQEKLHSEYRFVLERL